jgi:hypothetical protein
MSSKTCERCWALPPTITEGPFKGSRHELRYCAHCSKDLCEKCLAEGRCRDTPHGDGRHRVETDCPDCTGEKCERCEGTGTVVALVEAA